MIARIAEPAVSALAVFTAALVALPVLAIVVIAVAGFLVALARRTRLGKRLRRDPGVDGDTPALTAEEIDDTPHP